MTYDQEHNEDFYLEYHLIGETAFRDKVRFYENNQNSVNFLSDDERIDVNIDYALCLFEIAKYHKFLSIVDRLIEIVINDNIYQFNGQDIYSLLLFRKSACLFNTGQYMNSQKVLKSLLKIDRNNSFARRLFYKCKKQQIHHIHEGVKAVASLLLIAGIIIFVFQFFLIKKDYYEVLDIIKITLVGLGLLFVLSNYCYLEFLVVKEIGWRMPLSLSNKFSFFKKRNA